VAYVVGSSFLLLRLAFTVRRLRVDVLANGDTELCRDAAIRFPRSVDEP